MSSICGLVRNEGRPAKRADLADMVGALDHWGADARATWVGAHVGLGHVLLRNTPEGPQDCHPIHDGESGLVATVDARIDNREELAGALGLAAARSLELSDASLVLMAYERWGERCVHHLLGDFAFAIWDGKRHRLFCARDPLGVKPLYLYRHRGVVVFASEIKGILALPEVDRSLDDLWIGDFLCGLVSEKDRTMFLHVRRLPPGHMLSWRSEGVEQRQYWRFEAGPDLGLAGREAYVEVFTDLLERAVQRRLRSGFAVGAELSGGLDSSGICGLAQRSLAERGGTLHTFGHVNPRSTPGMRALVADGGDAIRRLASFARLPDPYLMSGEEQDASSALEWALEHYDEPPQIVNGLFKDLLFEEARRRGVRTVLSGFAGNQGVSSVGLYRRLGRTATWALRRPLHAWRRRKEPQWIKLPLRPIRDDVSQRLGMRVRTAADLRPLPSAPDSRTAIVRRLERADICTRLECGHVATTGRGMEFRYPLLDVELVSFYLGTPDTVKRVEGTGRWLFRSALAGVVPDDVRWSTARMPENGGAKLRRRRVRDELMRRLEDLPTHHRLFDYVDLGKVSGEVTLRTRYGDQLWMRDLIPLTLLLFARCLERA